MRQPGSSRAVKLSRGSGTDLTFARVGRPSCGHRRGRCAGRACAARASASTARCHSRPRCATSASMLKKVCMWDTSWLSGAGCRRSSSTDAAPRSGIEPKGWSSAAHGQSCPFDYAFRAAWLRERTGYAYVGDQVSVIRRRAAAGLLLDPGCGALWVAPLGRRSNDGGRDR